jgi:hypothetical protein
MMAQWIGLDLGNNKYFVIPYPWTGKHGGATDSMLLLNLARTSVYNPYTDMCIVTADREIEAQKEIREMFRLRKHGNPMKVLGISDDNGGVYYRKMIDLINEAMEISKGIQKDAATYLGITTRTLNYHLQCDELVHWCPRIALKRNCMTKTADK